MKKTQITIVAILFAGLLAQSCEKMNTKIEGIGAITTNTLQVETFSRINLEGADNVTISYGQVQEVSVTGHPNIISRIQTEVINNTWYMELEKGNYGSYQLAYHITIPGIEEIRNTGSGNVTVSDPFAVDQMKVSLEGSGSFFGFPLEASDYEVDINGSGDCEISVESELDVFIEGSGNVYYKGFPLIHEDITGSGRVLSANN